MTESLDIVAVVPRAKDLSRYTATARDVTGWSDAAGFDGILLFTGTGAVLDPWLGAAAVLAESRLHPIVAVNPAYMHPYTAARMVLSLGELWRRRIDLNLITGTVVADLTALGDRTSHDDRYGRLAEYIQIVTGLLGSPRPLSLDGEFYQVERLQLQPSLPPELRPRLFLAGQSAPAEALRSATGAAGMSMLAPDGGRGAAAVSFGVVTRPDADDAIQAAEQWFPADPLSARVAAASMTATDSTWKKRLFAESADPGDTVYRLGPFHNGQADNPYLVGDYDTVADRLVRLVEGGVRTFVVDLRPAEAEYKHFAELTRMLRDRLRTSGVLT